MVPVPSFMHEDSDKKRSIIIIGKIQFTRDRNEGDSRYQGASESQRVHGLHEGELLHAEGDRYVEEVQDDHEDQEHYDVEDDDVDVPRELVQPEDYAEGRQELSDIVRDARRVPAASYLKNDLYYLMGTVWSKE